MSDSSAGRSATILAATDKSIRRFTLHQWHRSVSNHSQSTTAILQ